MLNIGGVLAAAAQAAEVRAKADWRTLAAQAARVRARLLELLAEDGSRLLSCSSARRHILVERLVPQYLPYEFKRTNAAPAQDLLAWPCRGHLAVF